MMTKVLACIIALTALAAPIAWAGPNENGALLVHVNDRVSGTAWPTCNRTDFPTECGNLVTQSNEHDPTNAIIFLMATFRPEANPCMSAVRFGIRHNLPPNEGYIYGYYTCAGGNEHPDPGWPEQGDPGVGNYVTYPNLTGHLYPIYVIEADENGPGSYLGTRTYPGTGEATYYDCSTPPVEDVCPRFGEIRWFTPGWDSCPPPFGACCCTGGRCELHSEETCLALGGTWMGALTTCDTSPCATAGVGDGPKIKVTTWGDIRRRYR